ncbi:MAG: exosome complex RNA-binding protein Csl4 [Candidatus Marsarchaeota archaeon]|jgi:exosome complex RNA-binding protein Csl4|nr:exosome complex RNA-binding protein Csl4 [Candidatus Marsarchaeota archaeon]
MTEPISTSEVVFPGDRLSTEEEFLPARNVYVENGVIYSAVFGKASAEEGKMQVNSATRDIRKMKRGMFVLGKVVGVLKSVIFVEIENFSINSEEFIAGKDGKVVLMAPRPMHRGMHDRPPERSRSDSKPAEMGDVILAKIIMEDSEIFTLSLRDPEAGVVYALCDNCGNKMQLDKHGDGLYCSECKITARRKVSSLYDNSKAIEELLLRNGQEHSE